MSGMNDDQMPTDNNTDEGYGLVPQLVPTHQPAESAVTPEPVLQHAPVVPVAPVTGLPSNADDVDLIEKEWVEKAKQIVDSTTGDPYTQAKQLGQMKAEYVRKRYGRDLKTDE